MIKNSILISLWRQFFHNQSHRITHKVPFIFKSTFCEIFCFSINRSIYHSIFQNVYFRAIWVGVLQQCLWAWSYPTSCVSSPTLYLSIHHYLSILGLSWWGYCNSVYEPDPIPLHVSVPILCLPNWIFCWSGKNDYVLWTKCSFQVYIYLIIYVYLSIEVFWYIITIWSGNNVLWTKWYL